MNLAPAVARRCARRWGAALLAVTALAATAGARVQVPGGPGGPESVAARAAAAGTPGKLLRADVMVVAQHSLPARDVARVARLRGVLAARAVDAARVRVNGTFAALLGVDPATFRAFAAGPTASASPLWSNVADGAIAVSYTMGKQDKLPLGGTVEVAGRTLRSLRVAGFGTVGIGGVDAVISRTVAQSLGFPAGNAIVVSAPHERVAALVREIKATMPHGAVVEPLVTTSARGTPAAAGQAGASVATVTAASATANGRAALTTGRTRGDAQGRGQPGRLPVRLGRVRANHVRLLRAGAVVVRPGGGAHAAGGRGPGPDRARDPVQPGPGG